MTIRPTIALPTALLGAVLLCGCTAPPAEEVVLARVGDETITVREFVLDYEFGYPVLKRGADPARAYLSGMIRERLLAQEGYRRGLDRSAPVQRRLRSLREELLVGQVFDREVHDAVEVTQSKIDSVRFSQHVSFKLRFVPASGLDEAKQLQRVFQTQGHEEAVRQLAASEEGLQGLEPAELETDYIGRHDLAPEVLPAVDQLPIGEVSSPISHRGTYLLVQVVDIRREAVAAEPAPDELERFRQIAFQAEAKQASRRFVRKTVGDSGLRLKAEAYRAVEEALWYALQDASNQATLLELVESSSHPRARALTAILDAPLMETHHETFTVEQFLMDYPNDRYPISTRTFEAYRSDLYDGFGLLLRDLAFIEIAESRGYGSLPEVESELGRWERKWVYQALAEQERQSLGQLVDSLSASTSVWIDEQALADLDLSPRSVSVSLFRGSTGRPAWPVLDYGL